MKRKSFEHTACPAAQSLELVRDRWRPLVLREIVLVGLTRFDDSQSSLAPSAR